MPAAGRCLVWCQAFNRSEESLSEETEAETDKDPGARVAGNQSYSKSNEDTRRDEKMPAMSSPAFLFFNR
jgi:hypothetical protein